MSWRIRSVRTRILLLALVPVLSLFGLYLFTTSITARDAINLARADTVKNATGEPTGAFLAALDTERPLAMVYLAAPTRANQARLSAAAAQTSKAAAAMQAALTSGATQGNASPAEKQEISTLLKAAGMLPGLRAQISMKVVARQDALDAYNTISTDGYQLLNQTIRQEASTPVVTQALAFVRMGRGEEMLLREDALLLGDMAARSFPAADRAQFAQLVGARRTLTSLTLPDLDPAYRAFYTRDVRPQASAALVTLENTVMSDPRPGGPPPVRPGAWQRAVGTVAAGTSQAGTQAADALTRQASSISRSANLRLILAGGVGLLAVLLSIIVAILMSRSLVRELTALRQSALELANKRLPQVMARLAAGQDVDESEQVPAIPASSQEIGQVADAFVRVQQTAVAAAVGQAKLRQGISDVFRNLARRSQSLLHRQLILLDGMERRAAGPQELEDLFRIDHLTTRMRRHAESLIILSGDAPARGWRNPVPLVDVLRAAVAEVEDYQRIRVSAPTRAALSGPAVGDVIHLIAELAENAAIFSPPNTPVQITGDIVGQGFAVDIEDRGLGLSESRLAEINERFANPPDFDLSSTDQLGLFVAGQLAKRHGVRISLRSSPYGGTTAIVLIPHSLVVPERAQPKHAAATGAPAAPVPAAAARPLELADPAPAERTAGNGRAEPVSLPPADIADGDDPDADELLPRRVKQASLAPQLREATTGPDSPAAAGDDRSPEEARATMTAIQQGWERGRSVFDSAAPSPNGDTAATSPPTEVGAGLTPGENSAADGHPDETVTDGGGSRGWA